ncbi:hypothetical protein XENOCAPTIV_006200 [Xenoophorus captivus]|uniref:Gamma-tubulin complex component n=1 Tax=Xenoophorus captivus TaxID=1517983 RepID=A0ABV0RP18_9TELE
MLLASYMDLPFLHPSETSVLNRLCKLGSDYIRFTEFIEQHTGHVHQQVTQGTNYEIKPRAFYFRNCVYKDISVCLKLYLFDEVPAAVSLCYRGGGDHKIPEGGAAASQDEEEEDLGLGGLSGKQLRELQDLRLIEEENMLAPSLQQFSLRTEMLPSYIPIRVAEKILFVGESVQMFENHNHSPSRAGTDPQICTRHVNVAFQQAAHKVLLDDDNLLPLLHLTVDYQGKDSKDASGPREGATPPQDSSPREVPPTGWAALGLAYKVQWPLHILFTPAVLEKCVSVDVLESQFSQLLQQINSTRDFESIRLAHDHFLSNLLAQSFILLKPVFHCLNEILELCQSFCSLVGQSVASLDERGTAQQLDLLVKGFRRQSSLLFKILSSVRNHQINSDLAQLLLRLDYNKYYTQAGGTLGG